MYCLGLANIVQQYEMDNDPPKATTLGEIHVEAKEIDEAMMLDDRGRKTGIWTEGETKYLLDKYAEIMSEWANKNISEQKGDLVPFGNTNVR